MCVLCIPNFYHCDLIILKGEMEVLLSGCDKWRDKYSVNSIETQQKV